MSQWYPIVLHMSQIQDASCPDSSNPTSHRFYLLIDTGGKYVRASLSLFHRTGNSLFNFDETVTVRYYLPADQQGCNYYCIGDFVRSCISFVYPATIHDLEKAFEVRRCEEYDAVLICS